MRVTLNLIQLTHIFLIHSFQLTIVDDYTSIIYCFLTVAEFYVFYVHRLPLLKIVN